MRIPLLRGRSFETLDRDGAPPVVIVNDVLARRFWPNQEPLGKRIQKQDGRTFEVVGVAKTGKYDTLGAMLSVTTMTTSLFYYSGSHEFYEALAIKTKGASFHRNH